MKVRVNADGITSDIIDKPSDNPKIYATIRRTFRRRKNRKETYILAFNESIKGIGRLSYDILTFARAYAESKDAFVRVDGVQYMDIIFDTNNPLNSFINDITNIYLESDGGIYINTVTNSELTQLRESNIDIIYAPMSSVLFRKDYAVYRIIDDGPSLIRLGCNRKREIALPWMIIDEKSYDMSGIDIVSTSGNKINGFGIQTMSLSKEPIVMPMVDPDYVSNEDFNIEVDGGSLSLLEMNFSELSDYIGRKINLGGIEDIKDIKIDLDIFICLKSILGDNFMKKKYAVLVKEIIDNSYNATVFPFWRKIHEWNEQEIPCVFRIKFSKIDKNSYSTIGLNALIKEFSY